MAVRVTQQVAEVFRTFSSSDTTVYVTQQVLEVFYADGTFILDIKVSVADWLSQASTHPFDPTKNLKPSWKDGFVTVLLGAGISIGISIDDADTYRDDYAELASNGILSDTLSASDAAALAIGILKPNYDSLQPWFTDSFTLGYGIPVTPSDALSLTDEVSLQQFTSVNKTDTIFLANDLTALRMDHLLGVSDTLLLSDSVSLFSSLLLTLSDTLSLSDAAVVASIIKLTISESDTLSLSDALTDPSTGSFYAAEIEYIRRYLNDV